MTPLDVEIRLNHTLLETVWIARLDKFTGYEDIHQYIVGIGTRDTPPWSSPAKARREKKGEPEPEFPRFYHRYSDGARKCLQLALSALEQWEKSQTAG